MIAIYVLLGLVVLRWVLLYGGVLAVISRVRECPACFHDTVRVQRRWVRWVLPGTEWRWCPSCGWHGPSRRTESELAFPAARGRKPVGPTDPETLDSDPGFPKLSGSSE